VTIAGRNAVAFSDDFKLAFHLTLAHEGGFQDDPDDRGNWTTGKIGEGELKGTKYGISAMSYPNLDIKNLTKDEAMEIYHRDYWITSDAFSEVWPMNYLVFDAAVNHGVAKSEEFYDLCDGSPTEFLVHRMLFFTRLKTWPKYGRGWTRRVMRIATLINDKGALNAIAKSIGITR
jgi:lysozyme family protein